MFSELEIPSYLGNQIIEAENHLEGLEKASLDLISMTWHAFADNKGNCNYKLDSTQYTYQNIWFFQERLLQKCESGQFSLW